MENGHLGCHASHWQDGEMSGRALFPPFPFAEGTFQSPPFPTVRCPRDSAKAVIKVGRSLPSPRCAGKRDAPHHGNGCVQHIKHFQVLGQSAALIGVLLGALSCSQK